MDGLQYSQPISNPENTNRSLGCLFVVDPPGGEPEFTIIVVNVRVAGGEGKNKDIASTCTYLRYSK